MRSCRNPTRPCAEWLSAVICPSSPPPTGSSKPRADLAIQDDIALDWHVGEVQALLKIHKDVGQFIWSDDGGAAVGKLVAPETNHVINRAQTLA